MYLALSQAMGGGNVSIASWVLGTGSCDAGTEGHLHKVSVKAIGVTKHEQPCGYSMTSNICKDVD